MTSATSTGAGPQPAGLADGAIATVAGNGIAGYVSDGGPGPLTRLNAPYGVAADKNGNLYIADYANHRIRKVTPNGTITTVAGTGTAGYISDGGPAVATPLSHPFGVAVDDAGNVYIADTNNHRVRKVTPNGRITTVAGNGTAGYVSDGGPAIATPLYHPWGVAVDRAGNLYIGDRYNHRVRKVTPNGLITTVAGNGTAGYVSDGGPAIATRLYYPAGLAVDGEGSLYIADGHNHRIRKVTPNGLITTVAGNGTGGYVSDGGPALATRLYYPYDVTVDEGGSLYIADSANHRVRKVTSDGTITTVAGTGTAGYVDDGGPAMTTRLYNPSGVTLDRAGNLYIADVSNQRVRGVTAVAEMTPPPPPSADLYGEVVNPYAVPRDREFDLGARIRSRGPNPADGQYVTVVLTLAEGLTGGPGTTGRRLSRTFTGQQLLAHNGSLDGVFRVIAPATTPPGVYSSTLEIQYGGDLNLKDNVHTLPVTVITPAPEADETALTIYQNTIPDVAPGQRTVFTMRYLAATGQPVNPGTIVQRYTAPSGFVFSGQPTYAYYETIHGVVSGTLTHHIEDTGRSLVITANPHVNTTTSDTGSVIYSIPIQARTDALPGRYDNGTASVGRHTPVQISGRISGTAQDEGALRATQESTSTMAPGENTTFNLEIRSVNDQPVNPGTLEQHFIVPTGFAFTGTATYGYYQAQPAVTGTMDTRIQDNGKILVVTSNPHLNTGATDRVSLIYTIGIRALPDTQPGTQSGDGRAIIGRRPPIPLTARVA
ncbi:NHL repeat-containing protein [Streptomyces sp. HUAS TT7]|uniref:NHL repeat-containing protein n=1 Tax=Streptomyces sp. HUAS TT7 TaxID=3447507 RepID=UPI003F65F898